jgi:hypothetical protein
VKAHIPKPPQRRNISKDLRKALAELKKLVKDRTVRISPADKGGAIVVQNYEQYTQEAKRQLNNTTHYQQLTEDPTSDIARRSNELVDKLHNNEYIDTKCHEWAVIDVNKVRTPLFYHLPKIHKDSTNPPGRPIVSGVSGPTERLSRLVDHWLQPAVQALPSYLKDTTHLLQIINH